jgi:hypothetical protein
MERDQMAAFSIHPESVLARFWRDQGHAPVNLGKWAKVGLVLLILNEIRGLAVVGGVVYAWWG